MHLEGSINPDSPIFVAGHRGLVGSAILRRLRQAGCRNLITRTRVQLDLTDQAAVRAFFAATPVAQVYLAAAKVGGIQANDQYGGDFIRENLMIQTNVIDAAWRAGVGKLLFLGSSCIYPKHAPQPMREDMLLTGPLEPTNEPYAIAKIAGITMCRAYRRQYGFNAICVMPANLYGPGDNFDLDTSHVLPALIRKFHEAKLAGAGTITVWGSGTPRREFLHTDDLADACVYLMTTYNEPEMLNVGTGTDISIRELAELIGRIVGFSGTIAFDTSKPDGHPRKMMDITRLEAAGWRPQVGLADGIAETYRWFVEHRAAT